MKYKVRKQEERRTLGIIGVYTASASLSRSNILETTFALLTDDDAWEVVFFSRMSLHAKLSFHTKGRATERQWRQQWQGGRLHPKMPATTSAQSASHPAT